MIRVPYRCLAHCWRTWAPSTGRSRRRCRFCRNIGHRTSGIVRHTWEYGISGRSRHWSRSQAVVARRPQLGQARDLHVWYTTRSSVSEAKTSAPRLAVPHWTVFRNASRAAGRMFARSPPHSRPVGRVRRLRSSTPARNSQFPVPSSQFPVPSSQFPVPSSQFPVPSSQFPVPSSQFPVPTAAAAARARGVRLDADAVDKPHWQGVKNRALKPGNAATAAG